MTIRNALCAAALSTAAVAAGDEPAPGRLVPVELRLRLDKPVITLGESVVLTEVIPRDRLAEDPKVGLIQYTNCRLAVAGPNGRGLVAPADPTAMWPGLVDSGEGLPESLWCGHGSCVSGPSYVRTPRERGHEEEFRPSKPGVYLIRSFWHVGDGAANAADPTAGVVTGPPTVLTVLPKPGAVGQPWGLPWRAIPVELRCRLDKSVVTSGEPVVLTETVARAETEPDVEEVSYLAYRLAEVGPDGKKLVAPREVGDLLRATDDVGLPPARRWLKGNNTIGHDSVITPRERGREETFRPTKPGVYLIFSRWRLAGENGGEVTGAPVVLTVIPRQDAAHGE